MVVVLTIFTSLKLSTGSSCWDLNLQLQEVSVLLPSFPSLMAFLKFIFLLLTAGPKRHAKFSKSSLDIKKSSGSSFAVSPASSFHKSTSSTSVIYSLFTQCRPHSKTPLMYLLVFLMRGAWNQSQPCICPHFNLPWSATWCIHLTVAVHRMWAGQNKTETSRKCLRYVGCVWGVFSLLFLFSLCSVPVLFLSF